ncbi:MAG: PilN domain-containing protein [Planctomycetota bacterium]|jgi:Tfp pilus assembly protein PilN
MLKTALTTAELLEPVPRSVLLASLTNNLPAGVSLLKLNVIQKEPKRTRTVEQAKESHEKLLETYMNIEGVAPSDLQVAAYIKQLSSSSLLDNVALVESKEHKVEEITFRQFKLTAMLRKNVHLLRKNVHLSNEDIDGIRTRKNTAAWSL